MTETTGDLNDLAVMVSHGATAAAKLGFMVMWTLYKQPRDYPHGYIARKWLIGGKLPDPVSTTEAFGTKGVDEADLEQLREVFYRAGMTFIPRNEGDEPQIVGCWL
jgi:hypothetical protein